MLIEAARTASLRAGTRSTYKSNDKLFDYFCGLLGLDPEGEIEERSLCAMSWMFCHSRSVNSLDSWFSGVVKMRELRGLPPLPRGTFFKEHKKGLKAIFGPLDVRVPATPLTEADLLRLKASLNLNNYEQARFWFCVLIGFQALLRGGEISEGRLLFSDITRTENGLRVQVLFSKTTMAPIKLALSVRDDELCPREAFDALLLLAPRDERIYKGSYNAFNSEIKRRFTLAGVCKEGLTSHAMRRGGATALFMAGAPTLPIMASSDTWRHYVEIGFAQQLLPTQMLRDARRVDVAL